MIWRVAAVILGFVPFAESAVCTEEPELQRVSLLQRTLSLKSIASASVGQDAMAVGEISPLPPILFIKSHKTGSSTLINIIHRMGARRNMSIMLPLDTVNLGYPEDFPGQPQTAQYGPPQHQFDVICNHAVYSTLMYGYLKPHPHVIAIARKPTDQMISQYSYFLSDAYSWEEYLAILEQSEEDPRYLDFSKFQANRPDRFKNSQAFDHGWYDFVGRSTEFDKNQTKMSEWLATLEPQLDSVLLLEHFEEGLALFGQKIHVNIEELSYVIINDNGKKMPPTDEQRARLDALSNVDRALYTHFNQSFWQEWFRGDVSQLEADVVTLKTANEKLQHACDEGDSTLCPRSLFRWDIETTAVMLHSEGLM